MKNSILFLAIFVLTGFTSCKKIINTSDNQAKLITEKKWKLTVYTEGGVDMLHSVYEECDLDDITVYHTNGTVDTYQGETKCDPADIEITTGNWTLKNSLLSVGGDDMDEKLQFTVVAISSTTLRLTLKDPFSNEILGYTFKAQ